MENLLAYKTRGSSSPQGKPRVFFMCHPDDFGLYFDLLSDEILRFRNCVIYYIPDGNKQLVEESAKEPAKESAKEPAKEPAKESAKVSAKVSAKESTIESVESSAGESVEKSVEEPALSSQLAEMQMFVVPVTSNFLRGDCFAFSYGFGFAMQNHIPILPVMMERGLELVFADRLNHLHPGYGDIQYLDHTSTDQTEIPYEEKLETRLVSILAGDDLAARVRAAFDAYIFLSYRKKDRIHAQELMRLIHRIPYCRDIAVWYDEFLVPGEAWNAAISEAMLKSSAVAFAVTPSFTEPNNFIIEHEYPNAKAAGKLLVPAEMKTTDRGLMEKLFPGIPAMIDGTDMEAISEALRKIAVQEEEKSPEHNFLIGLAYLKAIDVERNPERALALITQAADAGLSEALRQLAEMYRSGNGVAVDYDEAVRQQERLCGILLKQYQEDSTDEAAVDYLTAQTNLGDYLFELRKLEEAKEAYEVVSSFCEPLLDEKDWAAGGLRAARSKHGKIYRLLGNNEQACSCFEKVIAMEHRLVTLYPGNLGLLRSLGVSLNDLGRTLLAGHEEKRAEALFSEALELFEKIDSTESTMRSRRDISCTLNYLGNCFVNRSVWEAERYYLTMLDINQSIMEEMGDTGAFIDYGISCGKLGSLYLNSGNPAKALEYGSLAVAVFEEAAEKTMSFETVKGLFEAYQILYEAYDSIADFSNAEQYARKQMDAAQKLDRIRECTESKVSLRVAYSCYGEFLGKTGKTEESAVQFRKAIDAGQQVMDRKASADNYHALASAYYNLGMVTDDKDAYRNAYKIWKDLKRIYPNLPQIDEYVKMAKAKCGLFFG